MSVITKLAEKAMTQRHTVQSQMGEYLIAVRQIAAAQTMEAVDVAAALVFKNLKAIGQHEIDLHATLTEIHATPLWTKEEIAIALTNVLTEKGLAFAELKDVVYETVRRLPAV